MDHIYGFHMETLVSCGFNVDMLTGQQVINIRKQKYLISQPHSINDPDSSFSLTSFSSLVAFWGKTTQLGYLSCLVIRFSHDAETSANLPLSCNNPELSFGIRVFKEPWTTWQNISICSRVCVHTDICISVNLHTVIEILRPVHSQEYFRTVSGLRR